MRKTPERNPRHNRGPKRKTAPHSPTSIVEERPISNTKIGPLSLDKGEQLLAKNVYFRGEHFPLNFYFTVTENEVLTEGQLIGFVRPVLDEYDPGQLLYWEQGQVIARSVNRPNNR